MKLQAAKMFFCCVVFCFDVLCSVLFCGLFCLSLLCLCCDLLCCLLCVCFVLFYVFAALLCVFVLFNEFLHFKYAILNLRGHLHGTVLN